MQMTLQSTCPQTKKIHLSTADDLTTVIQEAVQPFCRASGAKVSLPKSWGLTLGSHPSIVGTHGPTGIFFFFFFFFFFFLELTRPTGLLALPSRRP